MTRPGALLLKLRQWSEHGLVTAYYRDVVRRRILRTAPVAETTDPRCELHVMTCRADWLNAIWALKTFYHFSGRRYRLCIHEDGTVPAEALGHLASHFPAARIIPRAEADARSEADLRDYPRCLAFRRTNLLAPKLFDFAAYLESDRMLLFDSDLLFFREPTELLRRIEDPSYRRNAFNADCAHGYALTPEQARPFIGFDLVPRINSGLGLVHRASVRTEWCEEFLAIPGMLDGHFWRIEQTLFALCSSRFGVELLPSEYTVCLEPGIQGRPIRHYVGAIRHLMYREGMAHLLSSPILVERLR